jgi:hypothetical protein
MLKLLKQTPKVIKVKQAQTTRKKTEINKQQHKTLYRKHKKDLENIID